MTNEQSQSLHFHPLAACMAMHLTWTRGARWAEASLCSSWPRGRHWKSWMGLRSLPPCLPLVTWCCWAPSLLVQDAAAPTLCHTQLLWFNSPYWKEIAFAQFLPPFLTRCHLQTLTATSELLFKHSVLGKVQKIQSDIRHNHSECFSKRRMVYGGLGTGCNPGSSEELSVTL